MVDGCFLASGEGGSLWLIGSFDRWWPGWAAGGESRRRLVVFRGRWKYLSRWLAEVASPVAGGGRFAGGEAERGC